MSSGPTKVIRFGVHQVIAGAARGDAITNAALELRDLLRQSVPSELFARHISADIADEVVPLSRFRDETPRGLLVYHASIGEPRVAAFLLNRREPVVLVYHNITPSHLFERWDPEYAELLNLGRRELVDLQPRIALAIAASEFNGRELHEIGYDDVRVIPPVIDPHRLTRVEPDPLTLNHLDNVVAAPFAVAIGQMLPHKRVDLLVDSMHVASTYLGLPVLLMLVGHTRFKPYADAIRQQLRELSLGSVHLVGGIDDAMLAAMLRRASMLVTVSEHEGFCVPLLEAMAFDVPVIARASAAIPETLGDGGLLLPEQAGPLLIAEAIAEVFENDSTRRELVAAGRRRLEKFDVNETRASLLRALAEVA
jgi:glycosyltransferase involved in cell wall biosynthesis